MAKQHPATKYTETIIVVEGNGTFPTDMMRYDCCCPLSESDSSAIHHEDDKRRIVLRAFCETANKAATHERWRSFGWTVVWSGARSHFNHSEPSFRKVS